MNFITALIALALVLLGGYYVFYMVSPTERDAMIQEYAPDRTQAEQVFQNGVEQVNKLLPPR